MPGRLGRASPLRILLSVGVAHSELEDVTIVVLVHNPTEWYVETLSLVRSQSYAGTTVVHVIDSSDDHTNDRSRELAASADVYETLPKEQFGHARTRNRAADSCSTNLIVYLSGDAHPADDDWLSSLLRPILAREADVSYGRQRSPSGSTERETTYSLFYPPDPMIKTKESVRDLGIRAYHFSDVTSAYRTEVLRRVRFPDELEIFEDAGISKRLLDAGYAIAYEPDACVIHGHDRGWGDMWRHYRQLGYVYSKVGILDDVAAARRGGLAGEAAATFRRLAGSHWRHPVRAVHQAFLTIVKSLAFAKGKRDARRDEPARSLAQ